MSTDTGALPARHPVTEYQPLRPARKALIQVWVSHDEKARVRENARLSGYETVGAYVRACTLAQPRSAA